MADGINLNNGPISFSFESLIKYESFTLSLSTGTQTTHSIVKANYSGFILMFAITSSWQYGSSSTNGSLYIPASASSIFLGHGHDYNQFANVLFNVNNITMKNGTETSSTITFFCIP